MLLFNLALLRLARCGLAGSLAAAEPAGLGLPQSIPPAALDALGALRQGRHWTHL
jgi:hypothetical protein